MANKDNVYIDTNSRIFLIQDEIRYETIAKINFNLLYLIDNDNKIAQEKIGYKPAPIKIYINSVGGTVGDMWSLVDIIENSPTPIYTYCNGYAYSSAFLIFIAGHKRFCSTHSKFLCHQIICGGYGKLKDMNECFEECNREQKIIEDFIINKTNIKKTKLEEVKTKKIDWYIYPNEALKYGIADELINGNILIN